MVATEGTWPGVGTAARESAARGMTSEVGPAGGFHPEAAYAAGWYTFCPLAEEVEDLSDVCRGG